MPSRASIAGGDTIAAPLQKSAVFPPMVISMIAVGEQTVVWTKCSRRSRTSTTRKSTRPSSGLLSLLEPIMIVFLGVVVGGMVVAMYLPIFDMINAVQ
jgi:type IV pilus assembly protein PilC